ncbi:unnamed protein product [Dimorphilus gyrociliatus]|uniref:Uncharacterized protein n=1 Tax=Dimorphilus gyrociliatus TaxID=2664684 RepID=A0A7I8V9X0_9ANNE|nr:unnamed protein product [Dimorphilus gyrociliatus]
MGKNSEEIADMHGMKNRKFKMVGSYMKRTDNHLDSELKDLSRELKQKLGKLDGEADQVRMKAEQLIDEQENVVLSRRSSTDDVRLSAQRRVSITGNDVFLTPLPKSKGRRASVAVVSTTIPKPPVRRGSIAEPIKDYKSRGRRQSAPAIHLPKKGQDLSSSSANLISRRTSVASSLVEEEEEPEPEPLDSLKQCRYLRIPGHVERELSIDEVFADD